MGILLPHSFAPGRMPEVERDLEALLGGVRRRPHIVAIAQIQTQDAQLESAGSVGLRLAYQLERSLETEIVVAAVGRAGTATIHHCMTLHGSHGNRSDRWRRACVLNYMGGHVRVADDSAPLLRGAPPLPVGSVVSGELFPLVVDAGGPVDGSGRPVSP